VPIFLDQVSANSLRNDRKRFSILARINTLIVLSLAQQRAQTMGRLADILLAHARPYRFQGWHRVVDYQYAAPDAPPIPSLANQSEKPEPSSLRCLSVGSFSRRKCLYPNVPKNPDFPGEPYPEGQAGPGPAAKGCCPGPGGGPKNGGRLGDEPLPAPPCQGLFLPGLYPSPL